MIEKKRINELSATEYSDDLYVAVDSELSGTGSLQMKDLVNNIQNQLGETTIDYPDDPMGTGYKYMMTTKFTAPASDIQTSGEYVTIDILTNSTISSTVRNIPIPYVLNLSATQYSCAATNWNAGTSFFTQTRDPDRSLSAGPVLTPIGLSSTASSAFRNRSIHIVSKLATLEEMGVTEIYNGNPFSDVIGQEAYAFGSKRLDMDFSNTDLLIIQLILRTEVPQEAGRNSLAMGFAVNDTFATSDEIITGADRSVVDPTGAYMHLDQYQYRPDSSGLSVLNYRSNRGNQDFAFPEDFTTVMPADKGSYGKLFAVNQCGNIYYPQFLNNTTATTINSRGIRIGTNFNETKTLLNMQRYKAVGNFKNQYTTWKYVGDTASDTYIDAFSSLRLVVGTNNNYLTNNRATRMPPKFKIKDCILKIYKQ